MSGEEGVAQSSNRAGPALGCRPASGFCGFEEEDRVYMLYAIAGEQGIAIDRLTGI